MAKNILYIGVFLVYKRIKKVKKIIKIKLINNYLNDEYIIKSN